MNNIKEIKLKVLEAFRDSFGKEGFDKNLIHPKKMGISESELNSVLEMLNDENLITGLVVTKTLLITENAKITSAGLDFLENNK